MDADERLAAIRLHLARGVGPRTFVALVEHFGSALAAAQVTAAQLADVAGIGSATSTKIHGAIQEADPEAELALAAGAGVSVIVRGEPGYPIALTYLYDAPPVLYARGAILPEDARALAIVGMRKCSLYGQDQAERLAAGLARAGFTIVSGLARGIDSFAHKGALAGGGRTIAVLGNGLGTIYPPENKALAEDVVRHGAILSEFPMGIGPTAENFPRRNRILAALALGTIVVEAGKQSGSLITARLAAELGKEVFAVPNRVDAPGAAGVHGLIRDGAKLIETTADVLDEFPDLLLAAGAADAGCPVQGQLPLGLVLGPEESALLAAIDGEPEPIDVLAERSGLAAPQAAATLTILELKGLIRAVPGGRFVRRNPAQ